MKYRQPELLLDSHDVESFACRHESLTRWLSQRALRNHNSGASRVFIVATSNGQVAGYYAIAAGSVSRDVAPGRVRRNMPEPIPVAVLGRLATSITHEGRGIGSGMLRDAVLRSQRLSTEIGIRALLCHAIDEQAAAFYRHHGFLASPVEPLTLMLPLGSQERLQ